MKQNIKLSVIFPVYNERNTIEKVLIEWISELKHLNINYRIIVCEDGSNDGTSHFLKHIRIKYQLLLNQKSYRRGYGDAVIDGILTSPNSYILCVDSDGQCDPKDIGFFLENINKADVLVGHRIKRSDKISRILFSKTFGMLFKLLFPCSVHDPSAPYVLFNKKTILPYIKYLKFLKEGFWWGFIGVCVKYNLTIHQIPINHKQRIDGDTHVYKLNKLFSIAIRNSVGLFRLRFAD